MNLDKAYKKTPQERSFDLFKLNCNFKGVYLIFEHKYIFPGDAIPSEYSAALVPHYRFLNREERRNIRKIVKK